MVQFSRSLKSLLTLAASAAMTQACQAGCNCGVPPAPAAASGMVSPGPWNGAGWSGGQWSGAAWSGMPNYGNAGYSPGSPYSSAFGYAAYPNGVAADGPYWAPGGYEPRIGSPVYYHDPAGGQYVVTGNPYYDHFGPGFQRNSLHGHYRFPYYNYRAPWYYPGTAVYNRNTNFPW